MTGSPSNRADRLLSSEQSVDLNGQQIEDAQHIHWHHEMSNARAGCLITQLSDCVPPMALVRGDDSAVDQPVHAPLEARPSRLSIVGIRLLVRRAVRLLVAVLNRGISYAP